MGHRTRLPCEGCLEHNLLVWSLEHDRGSQEPIPASMAENQLSTPAWADLAAVYLKHHYLMLLIGWGRTVVVEMPSRFSKQLWATTAGFKILR